MRAGAAPDPVSDVFAFGLVALFLFDGRDPLPSDHPAAREVLEQRLAALHQVDPWLGDIVDLCLDEPALRYRNAAQLAEDLDLVTAGLPPQLRADRDGLTDLPTALTAGAVAVAPLPAVAPGRETVAAPQRVVATVEYSHAIDTERPCIASLRHLLAERLDAMALARFPGLDPAFRDGAERFRRFELVFDGARASLRTWPFQGNGLRWLDRKPVAFVYSALTRQTTTELQRRRHEFTYDIEATADVFADRATIEVLLTNCRREVLAIAVEVRAASAGAAANGE